jgi:hypothetical protein
VSKAQIESGTFQFHNCSGTLKVFVCAEHSKISSRENWKKRNVKEPGQDAFLCRVSMMEIVESCTKDYDF